MAPMMKSPGAKGILGLLNTSLLGGNPHGAVRKKKLAIIRTKPTTIISPASFAAKLLTSLGGGDLHDGEELREETEEERSEGKES